MPKGSFSGHLKTIYHEDLDLYEVDETVFFHRSNGDIIPVPKGLYTDFASSPRLFWFLFPKTGPYNIAAALHDFLCQGEFFPIWMCNRIFLEALEAIPEVPRWKIKPMHMAVEMGTWATYIKHTKVSVNKTRRLFHVSDNGKRPLWKDGIAHFV